MSHSTVRLRPNTHKTLKVIAGETGQTVQDTLDRAIEELHCKVYLEGLNRDYEALRSDPKALAKHQQELKDWDVTNEDGLEDA
jgi:hypothetical protein